MEMVKVNVPSHLASKRLSVTNYGEDKRKIQISTNFLPMFGFEKGTPVVEKSLGLGRGFVIELAEANPLLRPKKVYGREYKHRRNNPFETVTETSSKKLLDEAIPQSCKVVHVTFMQGRIIVKPMIDKVAERIQKVMDTDNPLSVFAACTSGVDTYAAQGAGFKIESVLEWRPTEKRDNRDMTETGALSAIGNCEVAQLFNENINSVSAEYLAWATKNNPATLFTVSLQCDDFSNAKSKKLKENSVTDLSSTIDMAYDALRIIEKLQFPMILLEQVPLFGTSEIGKMWDVRLRRMGYETFSAVLDARDHGGHTSRSRYFHFATSLPLTFEWPEAQERNQIALWDTLIGDRLDDFRDVTHTSSMQKGLESGRLRTITKDSTYAPTILKSQPRQAKDSVVIQTEDNRILWPDEKLLKDLMGLPEEFATNLTNSEQATEIIGQAVDHTLYERIIFKVKEHIEKFKASLQPTATSPLAA